LRDPHIPASGHSKAKRPLRRFVLSAQRSAGNMAHLLNSTSDAAPQRGSKFGSIWFYYRSKISRNYWLFEPKCRNNAEITYTQRLQIASYFP